MCGGNLRIGLIGVESNSRYLNLIYMVGLIYRGFVSVLI